MTMMPGVQIVNMRPSTPTAPTQQKTVATVSPRVVIGSSHMVGARPGQTNSVRNYNAIMKLSLRFLTDAMFNHNHNPHR